MQKFKVGDYVKATILLSYSEPPTIYTGRIFKVYDNMYWIRIDYASHIIAYPHQMELIENA